jgi:hypothetical protein
MQFFFPRSQINKQKFPLGLLYDGICWTILSFLHSGPEFVYEVRLGLKISEKKRSFSHCQSKYVWEVPLETDFFTYHLLNMIELISVEQN